VAALIAAQRAGDGIPCAVACRALGVSRSWFYKWKDGKLPPRAARRRRLKAEVARLFGVHEGKYGAPRITADLREAGWRVSQDTVTALMREQGLAARRKKRRRATTRPGKGRWRAPDLVKRGFPAGKINRKWFGDGTDIATGQGKLHLASVLDVASRRVLGFALSEHHDAQLAYGALAMAVAVRGGQVPGVIFHTDQGSETPRARSAARASGFASASRWAGRGRRWTTRSSSRGTRPWSSSCAPGSTSPPGRTPGPGWRNGSRNTTLCAGTRRSR
jgi:putative transposase